MNAKLKTLQILHLAFCSGIFLFAILTILIDREHFFFEANPANSAPFNPIFPVIALATISIGMFLFRRMISKIDQSATINSKIMQYQNAFIVHSAFLESGALINIVAFFLTKNAFFLIFAAIATLFLIRSRPTKQKLISTLQLQYPDTESF